MIEKIGMQKLLCIKLSLFVFLTVVALLGVALGSETTAEKTDADVLARIGDKVVTQKDLDTALKKMPENRRGNLRDTTLDQLIEVKVFSEEAQKAGLDKDPAVREELERATNETLAKQFIKKYIDAKAEPSEDEMKKYYSEHKELSVVPEGVFIQHILVKKQEDAQAILNELKKGASFEEMAKKKSIARSWKNDGHLGWLYKGRMDPEMEKVAFNLEKEKLSDVIKTKEGYEIIKVLNKSDKREITFEEAKKNIRYELFWKKRKELINKYYEDAKVDRKPAEKGVLFKIGDEAFKEDILSSVLAKAPDNEKEKVKQRWVHYFLEVTVFSREARKTNLEKDSEVTDEIKRRIEEVLAKSFRKKIMNEKVQVSDKDVTDYYQSHLEDFTRPVKVRATAIIVKTKEEAEGIQKELKSGVNWNTLTARKSVHSANSEMVDMGWFGKGEKDPVIEKAVFSLKEGQISDVVETKEGYQIIKVLEKGGGEVKPLDEVKAAIKMKLQAQKFEDEKKIYYEKAGVKIISTKN